MEDASKHDEILAIIARKSKSVDEILDSVFSFLSRNSDFFHVRTSDAEKIGFYPGEAQDKVQQSFMKFQNEYNERLSKSRSSESNSLVIDRNDVTKIEQDSEQKPDVKLPPPDISLHNGGSTDSYHWSQTEDECLLELPLIFKYQTTSPGMYNEIKAKVELSSQGFKLLVKGPTINTVRFVSTGNGDRFTADGADYLLKYNSDKFAYDVNVAESTWYSQKTSVSPLTVCLRIFLHLRKMKTNEWWNKVFDGESIQIKSTDIDATRKFEDISESAQAGVRKLMFDENQKRQGKLTSDQLQVQDLLKKAWNVEGSPFKDTPFDPTILLR